jgi:hypothetical protein
VNSIIPSRKADTTRLMLDSTDADLLVAVLPDLPGADEPFRPVTVDLNGSIAIRAKGAGQTQATELLLPRSQRSGPALRLVLDRNHLSRAWKLGFDAVDVVAPTRPVVCRNGSRTYVVMPLDANLAIPSSDDVLRVGDAALARSAAMRPMAPIATRVAAKVRPISQATAVGPAKVKKPRAPIVAKGPVEEAIAIQSDLRNVLGRVRDLSALIRRQRTQHRLVKQTLTTLKQLQGVGA